MLINPSKKFRTDVTRALQNSHNLDLITLSKVEDDNVSEREREEVWSEIGPTPTHGGEKGQRLNPFIKLLDKSVGFINAVLGDMQPDFP